MTKNSIKHILLAGTVCCGVAATFESCTDWDDHYEPESAVLPSQQLSLWANIEGNASLTQFASLLRQTGYDQKLAASQSYTVWAPADGTFDYATLSAQGADRLRHEFVENHIARNSYPATGAVDQRVFMLNEKMMRFSGSGNYAMQGVALTQRNLGCANGLVHVLQGQIPFLPNIYESLNNEQFAIDSICDFFHSYDVKRLNEQKSVQGPTFNGEITYLDSVFDEHNDLYQLYHAYIHREDSNYTMLVPTNTAWQAARERLRSMYNFVPRFEFMENTSTTTTDKKVTPVDLNADYLRDSLVNRCLMRDLFYNNNLYDNGALMPTAGRQPDSLVSTTGAKVYSDDARLLFANATYVGKSNGALYVTDSLAMRPWTSWCPEMVQEAERKLLLANSFSVAEEPSVVTVSSGRRNPAVPGQLSGNAFLLAQPSASNTNPEVDFYLDGVRSIEYSVYVVFVPATINDVNATALPNRAIITMGYADEKGKSQEKRMRNPVDNTNYFSNDPTKVDTVYLGDFQFPIAYVGTGNYYPYLRIRSTANAQYDRTLRIDCIILRPKELDTYMKENPGYRYDDGKY